jgi:hypothetical protein
MTTEEITEAFRDRRQASARARFSEFASAGRDTSAPQACCSSQRTQRLAMVVTIFQIEAGRRSVSQRSDVIARGHRLGTTHRGRSFVDSAKGSAKAARHRPTPESAL